MEMSSSDDIKQRPRESVKVAVASAIVDGEHPVDKYFANLPTPEEHESLYLGPTEAAQNAYMYAYSVFCTLILSLGIPWVQKKSQEDPILAYLWHCAAYTAVLRSDDTNCPWGLGMYPYLLGLVWDTGICQGKTGISKYSTRTQSLLNYFGWVILGRKDITRMVKKPEIFGPVPLRTNPNEDLSRLPGIHRHPEAETEDFSRLARLFQVAFNQFEISIRYNIDLFVLPSDGIVSLQTGMDGDIGQNFRHLGLSQHADLQQPVVRAALHYCACSDIGNSANSLLEFFFRNFCSEIRLVQFVLRNAATPMQHEGSSFRFNMEPVHMIAILTDPSGYQFALDSSAAQYGWVETIAPFVEYALGRIDRVISMERRRAAGPADTPRPADEAEGWEWVIRCIAEEIQEHVEVYLKANGGFDSVLELSDSQFNDICLELEASLRSEMQVRDEERFPEPSSDSESE